MSRFIALFLFACSALWVGCDSNSGITVFNNPPGVAITSPPDGSLYNEGQVITFEGQVSDDGDVTQVSLQWRSDKDGILLDATVVDSSGLVQYSTSNLTPGNHVVSLIAADAEGAVTEDFLGITVNDLPDPPELSIVHPASGESGVEGEAFEFVAYVEDAQDEPENLIVDVFSDIDGELCTITPDITGVASCEEELTPGEHYLTFEVVDSDEYSVQESVYFVVLAGTQVDNDGDGWTEEQGDCNDLNESIHPGADEVYNDVDDDCDGIIDEGTVNYDDDGDGYTELEGDCDDGDDDTYPGAPELADGDDNDCDDIIDEGTKFYDDDGDCYCEEGPCAGSIEPSCTEVLEGDCDDADASIHAGASEACDDIDNDCDGDIDEAYADGCNVYYLDADGDGYGSSSSQCLCEPEASTGYDASVAGDCFDYNIDARPGQTAYFTSDRGDGSFDYNCNGSIQKYYSINGSCGWEGVTCDITVGWHGGDPGCGNSRKYLTNHDQCSADWPWESCEVESDTPSRTQSCH